MLGEQLTPVMLGSFVLILGGSVLATRPGQRRARAEARPAGAAPAGPELGTPDNPAAPARLPH